MKREIKMADESRTVVFQIQVELGPDEQSAQVEIACNMNNPPLTAVMVATEHMMNSMCMISVLPYEEALQLLCEGAKQSRSLISQGRRPS
jgi:hypothetical protein